MEFLTYDQCREFAKRVGVPMRQNDVHLPYVEKKHAAVFYEDSLNPVARRCGEIIAEFYPKYTSLLMWITGSPGGDGWEGEEYAYMRARKSWQRFVELRKSLGEERRLYETPGHLLTPDERHCIPDFAEPAILHGWDTLFLARPNVTAIYTSHNDDITVQSDKNISSLSAALTGLGLTRGDAR
jgi:hypothetical protein